MSERGLIERSDMITAPVNNGFSYYQVDGDEEIAFMMKKVNVL